MKAREEGVWAMVLGPIQFRIPAQMRIAPSRAKRVSSTSTLVAKSPYEMLLPSSVGIASKTPHLRNNRFASRADAFLVTFHSISPVISVTSSWMFPAALMMFSRISFWSILSCLAWSSVNPLTASVRFVKAFQVLLGFLEMLVLLEMLPYFWCHIFGVFFVTVGLTR